MRSPLSVEALENLGRERLSPNFFMRDFLYSEVASIHRIPNIPENPDLAIETGKRLCEELLEPLQATFGRIAIRSAYRSPTVNAKGNEEKEGCARNESNYAAHIWDYPDKDGKKGAMACIVVPWLVDYCDAGGDWRGMAYWIHNHLPYGSVQFFSNLRAFNIGWHEAPKREIECYIPGHPRFLLRGEPPREEYASWYAGFPPLKKA